MQSIIIMAANITIPTYSDDEIYNEDVQSGSKVDGSVASDVPETELPIAHSSMASPVIPVKSPEPAKKKKRQIRNIKDGKINVVDRRKGRDVSDTFYYRKNSIKQAAINLHKITGAAVEITIKPLMKEVLRVAHRHSMRERGLSIQDDP